MAGRKYRGSDVQMLLASNQIAERGIENAPTLSQRRTLWDVPYFTALKNRIEAAFEKNIGKDILSQLKLSTSEVENIITAAHRGVMALKVEIEVAFRKDPARMSALLTQFGYVRFSIKNGSQASYVDLLLSIKANLTPEIRAELEAAGINPESLDLILEQATQLIKANELQEALKLNRKSVNAVNVGELNDIYDDVISICKLIKTYFASEPQILSQFNFTNALKAQGYSPAKPPKTS